MKKTAAYHQLLKAYFADFLADETVDKLPEHPAFRQLGGQRSQRMYSRVTAAKDGSWEPYLILIDRDCPCTFSCRKLPACRSNRPAQIVTNYNCKMYRMRGGELGPEVFMICEN